MKITDEMIEKAEFAFADAWDQRTGAIRAACAPARSRKTPRMTLRVGAVSVVCHGVTLVGESFRACSRMFHTCCRNKHRHKWLILLEHPGRFELPTSAFGGRALVVNFLMHYSVLPSVPWYCVSMVRQMRS